MKIVHHKIAYTKINLPNLIGSTKPIQVYIKSIDILLDSIQIIHDHYTEKRKIEDYLEHQKKKALHEFDIQFQP